MVVTVSLHVQGAVGVNALRADVAQRYALPPDAVQVHVHDATRVRVQLAFDDVQRGLDAHHALLTQGDDALPGVVIDVAYAEVTRTSTVVAVGSDTERAVAGVASGLVGMALALVCVRVVCMKQSERITGQGVDASRA